MAQRSMQLNLEKDILEGWEPFYDRLNLEVLRIARKLGHQFPPVDIVLEEGVYRLAYGISLEYPAIDNRGGHTRAALALQDKFPLSCRILGAHHYDPKKCEVKINFIPISQIRPERKTGYNCLGRLATNLNFLPEELRKKFIADNDLVLLEDGRLLDGDNYRNPPPF
jgi:hypothetical protein